MLVASIQIYQFVQTRKLHHVFIFERKFIPKLIRLTLDQRRKLDTFSKGWDHTIKVSLITVGI